MALSAARPPAAPLAPSCTPSLRTCEVAMASAAAEGQEGGRWGRVGKRTWPRRWQPRPARRVGARARRRQWRAPDPWRAARRGCRCSSRYWRESVAVCVLDGMACRGLTETWAWVSCPSRQSWLAGPVRGCEGTAWVSQACPSCCPFNYMAPLLVVDCLGAARPGARQDSQC